MIKQLQTNIGDHQPNVLDEDSEQKSKESNEFFKQLVQDSLELIIRPSFDALCKTGQRQWTAKDQTHKADYKQQLDHNHFVLVKSGWLDKLRSVCTVLKQRKRVDQLLRHLQHKRLTVQMLNQWDNAVLSAGEANTTTLVKVLPTVEQDSCSPEMTKEERTAARCTLKNRIQERRSRSVVSESFGSWVFLVDNKISIKTVTQQKQRMQCAGAIREWKSTLQLIRLKMRRKAQFHINVLHSAYEGWRNRTRQIFTRRQELLSKYTADFAGKSCTVGLIEAFDKTLLNIARILRLDKRRIRSNYCFMFQTLQNVTVIHEYIAECDL